MYRQGDIYLKPLSSKPPGKPVKTNGKYVIARGSSTGHTHAIDAKHVSVLRESEKTYLVVRRPSNLTHDEHGTIIVASGYYLVVHQREYTPQEIRNVQD